MTAQRPDEIRQSITINAPLETVWALVSEPGWWINDGELVPHDITETVGPDGARIADIRGHSAGTWRILVVELRDREYAAFRWAPHAAAGRDATGPTGSTLIEFTLREASVGQVIVEVTESGFRSLDIDADDIARNFDDNAAGWGVELAALKSAAESA